MMQRIGVDTVKAVKIKSHKKVSNIKNSNGNEKLDQEEVVDVTFPIQSKEG